MKIIYPIISFEEYAERASKTDDYKADSMESLENSAIHLQIASSKLQLLIKDYIVQKKDEKLNIEINEQIGDLIWYLSNIAKHTSLKFGQIANHNLEKIDNRVSSKARFSGHKNMSYIAEDLPNRLTVAFVESPLQEGKSKVALYVESSDHELIQIGDKIDDNSWREDFYRYHDVLHFSFMVFLGWSPVSRALLNRKRKSDPDVDRIEDGARATLFEEAIAASVFKRLNTKNGKSVNIPNDLSESLYELINTLTKGLEVHLMSKSRWEKAIITGLDLMKPLSQQHGGVIQIDKSKKILKILKRHEISKVFKNLFNKKDYRPFQKKSAA